MLKNTVKFLLLLSLVLSASQVQAVDWANPTFDPPTCPAGTPGCDVPLNVSNNNQTKAGGLIIGGLRSVLSIFIGDSNTSASTVITDNASQSYFSKRGTGPVIMDFTPEPAASQYGTVRFFRTTNTTGYKAAEFLRGNGLNEVDSRVGVGGNNSFFNFYGGNVGVGTNAPTAPLNIKRDPVGGLPGWVGQVLIEPATNSEAGLTLKSMRTGAAQLWSVIAGNGVGNANFRIFNGGNGTDALNIDTANNVGIGTITPASKLDVNGDVCWTTGGKRQCLSSFSGGTGGTGGSSWWDDNQRGDITNNNPTGQVNIQGQLRIIGGAPANNKILISSNNSGLATWANASDIPGVGGIGNDVLNTTFSGCSSASVLQGCPIRSGDAGPTVDLVGATDVGSLRMTCPAGYKVVSGGAECDNSFNVGVAASGAMLNASRPINNQTWEVQCIKINFTVGALFFNKTINAMKQASITCAR